MTISSHTFSLKNTLTSKVQLETFVKDEECVPTFHLSF